jgi:hypothetical protein
LPKEGRSPMRCWSEKSDRTRDTLDALLPHVSARIALDHHAGLFCSKARITAMVALKKQPVARVIRIGEAGKPSTFPSWPASPERAQVPG